jgi:hypothetical protein
LDFGSVVAEKRMAADLILISCILTWPGLVGWSLQPGSHLFSRCG